MSTANLSTARSAHPEFPTPSIDTHVCGFCVNGRWPDGERCLECTGTGFSRNATALNGPATPAPRPPAVMPSPCVDCAYRPGSPEREARPEGDVHHDPAKPFYCHKGMPQTDDGYQPTAWRGTEPFGYLVCGGWWDYETTGTLPVEPYTRCMHRTERAAARATQTPQGQQQPG